LVIVLVLNYMGDVIGTSPDLFLPHGLGDFVVRLSNQLTDITGFAGVVTMSAERIYICHAGIL
jgi:hypothetical protein